MSAHSMRSGIYSPNCRRHANASTPPALSASMPATAVAPAAAGNGFEHVEMQFLSDVYLRCPDCDGRRYRAEVLECKLSRGGLAPKSIADVLDLTVSEALAFFAADAEVLPALGAARRRGARLPAVGSTRSHLVRRRSPAPEAGRSSCRECAARSLAQEGDRRRPRARVDISIR